MKGYYEDFYALKATKNKAKQSQYYLAPRFIWGLKGYLKKQSQFFGGQIYAISVIAMVYGVFSGFGLEKNKANQSQSVRPLDFGEELPDCSKPVSRSSAFVIADS